MQVTVSPAPKSTLVVDVEVPADRLDQAIVAATRRLAARTRVPGFRPGRAPRVMLERVLGPGAVVDEAVEELVEAAWRDAVVSEGIVPIAPPSVEVVTAEEGQPLVFKATVAIRPEIALGDYSHFPFKPDIDPVDGEKIARVLDELRDQQATLVAVEDRGAANGDWAVIGFAGTRDGVPVDGGSAERMPLVLGEERLIPGFEGHLLGLRPGEETEFDITFPGDYPEESLRGVLVHFSVSLRELRAKVLPEATDEWAQSLGDFDDLAALKADVRQRLELSALDRARHHFADRIIEYSVQNASVDLPDILVDDEVEVMRDELHGSLARQGMTEEAYLKAAGKTTEDLLAEMRPAAEQRAKTLLVLGKIAEQEGVEVTDAEVVAEAEGAKARYASQPKLAAYFDSDRARMAIRSTLRRSRVVEKIIDEWLAAHPDHPAMPHLEDGEPERLTAAAVEEGAAVEADLPAVEAGAAAVDVEAAAGAGPTEAAVAAGDVRHGAQAG